MVSPASRRVTLMSVVAMGILLATWWLGGWLRRVSWHVWPPSIVRLPIGWPYGRWHGRRRRYRAHSWAHSWARVGRGGRRGSRGRCRLARARRRWPAWGRLGAPRGSRWVGG